MSTETRVTTARTCDVHGGTHPALYDAHIPGQGWANVCQLAFDLFGCELGTGKGQRLIVEEPPEKGNSWIDQYPDQDKVAKAIQNYKEHRATLRTANYDGGDNKFGYWLHLVDRRMGRLCGLSIFDMEDYTWRDSFDQGLSPSKALEDFAVNADDEIVQALFNGVYDG